MVFSMVRWFSLIELAVIVAAMFVLITVMSTSSKVKNNLSIK